ncbi:hypothetical protein JCM10207_004922 [Rhodosporidiobolus poonsookiae]
MTADPPEHTLTLSITHAGRTLDLVLPLSSPLGSLSESLSTHYNLSPASLKLLVKGKKLTLDPPPNQPEQTVEAALRDVAGEAAVAAASGEGGARKPIKALLVGTKRSELEALHAAEALRAKKHAAFLFHQAHPAARLSSSSRAGVHTLSGDGSDDPARYRFYELQPFPASVPQLDKRKAMLERLAADPAVLDVMRRHKFAVGVLTELHPLLQPTLLGLNTNAGEKVSLRLLTDSLDGCRAYSDVRRVLLHELAHNKWGPHDNNFKELNSLLNKEVAAFESTPYFEPWDPAALSASDDTHAHRLNEEQAERVWDKLRFGLEDEVEERRERAGRAAEERARRLREGR